MNYDSNRKSLLSKRSMALILPACGLIALIIACKIATSYLDIGASKKQMDDVKRYMDSLTDKDIQAWIRRTRTILEEDGPKDFTKNREVPPDLQRLGITGIEEQSGEVDYVWFGGMDDTALDFVQSNGAFQVFAVYTPYSNRMIWPKR